jgi:hypothetical protein
MGCRDSLVYRVAVGNRKMGARALALLLGAGNAVDTLESVGVVGRKMRDD